MSDFESRTESLKIIRLEVLIFPQATRKKFCRQFSFGLFNLRREIWAFCYADAIDDAAGNFKLLKSIYCGVQGGIKFSTLVFSLTKKCLSIFSEVLSEFVHILNLSKEIPGKKQLNSE